MSADSEVLTYPNWVFSMFAFIGFLLSIIPLPWHLEGNVFLRSPGCPVLISTRPAWNTGTCLFMIWTGLACLNQFINSIIWNGNVINWAPVWCDICEFSCQIQCKKNFMLIRPLKATRFMIGSAVAIPAASLCINRRLYYIATANAVTITKSERRRAVLVDLGIGIGIPVLEMVLRMSISCFSLFLASNPFVKNTSIRVIVSISSKILVAILSLTTPGLHMLLMSLGPSQSDVFQRSTVVSIHFLSLFRTCPLTALQC